MSPKELQQSLFGDLDDFTVWKQEWQGMPEFIQEDLSPWRTIEVNFKGFFDDKGYFINNKVVKVHFEDKDYRSIEEFGKLLGIRGVTSNTKFLQFGGTLQDFSELVKQTITLNTRSIWYPEAEIGRYSNKRYIDEP